MYKHSPYRQEGGRTSIKTSILLGLILSCILSGCLFWGLVRGRTTQEKPHLEEKPKKEMARSLILWLHGLGDTGPNNMPIKNFFSAPEFANTKWLFPSAPSQRVTCNNGLMMPAWFDLYEIPVTAESPKDEEGIMKTVKKIHEMIDKEAATGISHKNIFVCGFSQGGALTLASTMLYPKTLGGAAVFSGWVPFNNNLSFIENISPEAKQTPILWSHGMSDNMVDFGAGQVAPPLLERAGVSCQFKAYPALGHAISPEELAFLEGWIKGRIRSSSH